MRSAKKASTSLKLQTRIQTQIVARFFSVIILSKIDSTKYLLGY